MTELANWVAGAPYDMPDNYSSLGGYAFNPYDPRRDPRPGIGDGMPVLSPGGSSSGIGTSANLWVANVGTETSGSILWPSNRNMLVGIKPTVGRVSRHGIIPITADQDTAGPMARTVTDAAILLGVLESREADPADPATGRCEAPPNGDYTAFLDADGLQGARIGVPRAGFVDPVTAPGLSNPRGGLNPAQTERFEEAVAILEAQGAIVVDPANLPTVVDPDPDRNIFSWGICAAESATRGNDSHCSIVFKYGMKRDFNAWLDSLGSSAPMRSLTELREWNRENALLGTLKYEQALLDISDEVDLDADRARYEADRAKDIELTSTHGSTLRSSRTTWMRCCSDEPGRECFRKAGLSHGHRAHGFRPKRGWTGISRELRTTARAIWSVFRRTRLQRAPVDRAGVRFRAGDLAANSATEHTLNGAEIVCHESPEPATD